MNKSTVIGIDVGGSTTKIVGFNVSENEKKLISPMFVRATDPITSIYGAFGKFLDSNELELSDIEKVMITGAGSSYFTRPIYNLPCELIDEFTSIGRGGLYVSGLKKAIIASCGTGTALCYSEKKNDNTYDIRYLGGTGVGGGTLIGLSKIMLDMNNVDHIAELAKDGDLSKIDLMISDITKSDITPDFADTMTASNFGKISDLAEKSDIALGVMNMVFETIGMIARFAAMNFSLKDVVLTGNLSGVPQAKGVFDNINKMFDMNFTIPENSRFGTVIGAALVGCERI